MRLHEYQSKILFLKNNIPIPRGKVASTPGEARQFCEELGGSAVIKAQVLIGGRGKAGGIHFVKSPEEAEKAATQILKMKIHGFKVRKVLVDEAISISTEIYLGITNDRNLQQPVLIASSAGGVEIEEIARTTPEKISRININPLLGLRDYQVRDIAININLDRKHWKPFNEILQALWKVYSESDATLAEINPLVTTPDNRLIALDAKVVLDDNALYRHPELLEMRDTDADDPVEVEGRKFGLSFIKLKGSIGCMVNGAGLAMATMDIIKYFGEAPANFLDIGGGASSEKVAAALRLIMHEPEVKAILVNVFGGITRCDEVAKGLLVACAAVKPKIPIIVRLVGTNEEEGKRLLSGTSLIYADTLVNGAKKAIQAVKEAAK